MSIKNIRVILVNPKYGGNIGAVCRAMKNTGLNRLTLIDPAPEALTDPMLFKMALNAIDIFEARQNFTDLQEAITDCRVVAATSARVGFYRAHSMTLRDWAPEFIKRAANNSAAIVFGREDKGLSNDELKMATHIVQIPTHKSFTSLNLSQAVMICCYELFLAGWHFKPQVEQSPEACIGSRERMFDLWADAMIDIGFCKPDKLEHMMMGLRRILTRGKLTEADAQIMMGLARQSQWAAKNSVD